MYPGLSSEDPADLAVGVLKRTDKKMRDVPNRISSGRAFGTPAAVILRLWGHDRWTTVTCSHRMRREPGIKQVRLTAGAGSVNLDRLALSHEDACAGLFVLEVSQESPVGSSLLAFFSFSNPPLRLGTTRRKASPQSPSSSQRSMISAT